MRTLDRTVSICLRTGKTARVGPSVMLKRYIRDWCQPKCTIETNCDIRSTLVSFVKSNQNYCDPYSWGLSSTSTESLHSSTQRRTKVLILHTSEALWPDQQKSTMALHHSAEARSQERPSKNLVGRVYPHTEYRIQTTSHQGNRLDVTVFDKLNEHKKSW